MEEEEKKKIITLRFIYGGVRLTQTLIWFFASRAIFPVPDSSFGCIHSSRVVKFVYLCMWDRERITIKYSFVCARFKPDSHCSIFFWLWFSGEFSFFFRLLFHLILHTFMLLHGLVCIDRSWKRRKKQTLLNWIEYRKIAHQIATHSHSEEITVICVEI